MWIVRYILVSSLLLAIRFLDCERLLRANLRDEVLPFPNTTAELAGRYGCITVKSLRVVF